VMLTDLAGRAVVDRAGRRGRLTDLAIDLFGGACPPVALLVVERRRPGSSGNLVPWDEVLEVGDPILVADLDAAPPRLGAGLEGCELLKRDILDALGLDLFALLGG